MNILTNRWLHHFRSSLHHSQRGILCLFFSVILLSVPAISSSIFSSTFPRSLTNTLTITLDCTQTNGVITSYGDINCGPVPNLNVKDGVDLTHQYQEVGIRFIRTHDFAGPTDISTIFLSWSADPTLETNYNFTSSDVFITGIINAGCQVFYRLGESAGNNESHRTPPDNVSKWAEICKHIVMHYNDGWKNGFHYNITYWEIWNEPDLNGFWNGTSDEYYHLYQATVETLKAYNSSLKIGGPCTSSVTNSNYTTGFLTYLVTHQLPLNFFCWHHYANTPYELYVSACMVRTLLDSYGFIECENINTEWNVNILTPQRDKDNAQNAAFTCCSFSAFQDARLDHAFRYRGTQDPNWLMRLIGFDLSLFTYKGVYKTPALAYYAMHHLIQDSPCRLASRPINASSGITYLAGISDDKSNITILVSNYDAADTTYTLNLSNLPWNTSYTIVHYLIDDHHHFEITQQNIETGKTFTTTQPLERSTVHLIRLTNTSLLPEEGQQTAKIPLILRLRVLDPFTRLLGILIFLLIFG